MEHFDHTGEGQIWQRVFSQPDPPQGLQLQELLLTSMELASAYRQLASTLTGRDRELAKQLWETEGANAACLKGIAQLSGQREEVLKVWPGSREPVRKTLEQCYHRSRRCLIEYTARFAQGEFGVVFQHLAQREGENCEKIARLLGGLRG